MKVVQLRSMFGLSNSLWLPTEGSYKAKLTGDEREGPFIDELFKRQ